MEQYLRALIRSMEEKIRCLSLLQEKTDKQTQLLTEETMDWDAFDALIDEKAELIEELDGLDDGFTSVFDRIKDELDKKRAEYKEEIATLKQQIRKVTEQSTSLMASEQRNKDLVIKQTGAARREIAQRKTSSRAAANYYKSMNQINMIDPQLMDKKK